MAFSGPTVGEKRDTAQLNGNLGNIGDMLGELSKSLQKFTEAIEANTKALQEFAKSITPGWVLPDGQDK